MVAFIVAMFIYLFVVNYYAAAFGSVHADLNIAYSKVAAPILASNSISESLATALFQGINIQSPAFKFPIIVSCNPHSI